MTNTSDSPGEARLVGSHRQDRIAHAAAHTNALIRQRVDWYRARDWPAEKIARVVGILVAAVGGENSA